MTQEEKNLLLIDLCARLLYGVICDCLHDYHTKASAVDAEDLTVYYPYCDEWESIEYCKPYLRPMSSMTVEEIEELAFIRDRDFQSVRKWINDESIKETRNICPITYGEVDFCNKKHLDYRGLIEKGLALEAPEDMYK